MFFALAAAAALLSSCAISVPDRTQALYIDFSEWQDAGFYLSNDRYPGENFIPCGELQMIVDPGFKDGKQITYTADELVDMAVKEVMARKTNGLVNFELRVVMSTSSYLVDHYEMKGTAIRILDKGQ